MEDGKRSSLSHDPDSVPLPSKTDLPSADKAFNFKLFSGRCYTLTPPLLYNPLRRTAGLQRSLPKNGDKLLRNSSCCAESDLYALQCIPALVHDCWTRHSIPF